MYCVIVVYSAVFTILSSSTICTRECGGKGHEEARIKQQTYPKVLIKPLVEPSAYREQMSPMWRKLDILSDMVPLARLHLGKINNAAFYR